MHFARKWPRRSPRAATRKYRSRELPYGGVLTELARRIGPKVNLPVGRLISALVAGLLLTLGPAAVSAQDTTTNTDANGRVALLADLNGVIGPASVRYVGKAIEAAEERRAEILILRIDTPGGLETSMREMIADILASPIPVIGFVAPPGARAASAGTYIMYATHVAAMAPGTNLGAATPIQIGGGGLPGVPSPEEDEEKPEENGPSEDDGSRQQTQPSTAAERKAVNDAVAFIRSLAELRGRNVEWAEEAVRQGASLSANQALERDVIDVLAADVDDLLQSIDGKSITVGRAERTLSTEGLTVVPVEPDFLTNALGIFANPNVALILMMIGIYGLIFEFANPGTIGPGIVGAICLVLGLYALNQLPLDYAGLALLLFGIALMVAEAFTPAFGVLGTGGLIAFIIGATMLIDTDIPAFQISWTVIAGTALLSGAILILLLGYVWRTYRRPASSGAERLVGSEVEVLDWSRGEGHVWAEGERWNARADTSFKMGEKARVQTLDGITLVIAPLASTRDG